MTVLRLSTDARCDICGRDDVPVASVATKESLAKDVIEMHNLTDMVNEHMISHTEVFICQSCAQNITDAFSM